MIVDASVAFKWLVPEPDSAAAIAWLRMDVSLFAPGLILAEIGNAVTKSVRRKELGVEGTQEQFARLPKLLILLDDAPFMTRAFDLAIGLRHSFYDCVYLAAAEALQQQLLTADAVFAGKLAGHPLNSLVTVLGQHD